MTRFRPILLSLCLALGFAARPAGAKSDPVQESLADLRKALNPMATAPAPGSPAPNPSLFNAPRYLSEVEAQINQQRFVEAGQLLAQMRQLVPAENVKASAAIEQLIADIRAQSAELAGGQGAYAELEQDFVAKFNGHAPAVAYDALLQRIAPLSPAGANNYGNPAAQRLETLRNFITRWQDYLLQAAAGNSQQAYQTINELAQQSARLPILPRSQLITLAAEAGTRANTANPQLDTWRKKLSILIDCAKSAADFDSLLAELPPGSNGSPNNPVEQLRHMAMRWQEYYSLLDSGAGQPSQNLLREIASDPNSELYYPRSKILARINGRPLPPPMPAENPDARDPLVPPEKLTLATLDQFARQLAARRGAIAPGAEDIFPEVLRLRAIAHQLQVGNIQAAQAGLNTAPGIAARWSAYADVLFILQQQLLTRNFALLINAPEALQPAEGEFFEKYIARVWQYGREQKDWALIYRMLVTKATAVHMATNAEGPDLQAYTQFFGGLQQERVGLWSVAVRSYLNAIQANSPNLPVEEVGARLAALKAAHHEDYLDGEKASSVENSARNFPFGVEQRTNLPIPPPHRAPSFAPTPTK